MGGTQARTGVPHGTNLNVDDIASRSTASCRCESGQWRSAVTRTRRPRPHATLAKFRAAALPTIRAFH